MVFFFLQNKAFPSIFLVIFLSGLSSVFSPLSAPAFFFIYSLDLIIISITKIFFFHKSYLLFFILLFLLSFTFPYLYNLAQNPSNLILSLHSAGFYFLKALSTLTLGAVLFPIFKKHLQTQTEV